MAAKKKSIKVVKKKGIRKRRHPVEDAINKAILSIDKEIRNCKRRVYAILAEAENGKMSDYGDY